MKFDIANAKWTRRPKGYHLQEDLVEIVTEPHTDLWQRTYYHFRNDNAPVLQIETEETYFSFVVKTDFSGSHHRFDQCGIVMYLDSENWIKGSVEYEDERWQHLGSVVTDHGYSDWATTRIPADIKTMWYRFSRREDDYRIECSQDGKDFQQMDIDRQQINGSIQRAHDRAGCPMGPLHRLPEDMLHVPAGEVRYVDGLDLIPIALPAGCEHIAHLGR